MSLKMYLLARQRDRRIQKETIRDLTCTDSLPSVHKGINFLLTQALGDSTLWLRYSVPATHMETWVAFQAPDLGLACLGCCRNLGQWTSKWKISLFSLSQSLSLISKICVEAKEKKNFILLHVDIQFPLWILASL